MATLTQRSFAGGEISPSLYARVDFNRYQISLRTCRNFIVQKHGGVANRPGTKFIDEVKDSTKRVRLIPFIFNRDQTYVLEFGNLYIRFIKDGAYIKVMGLPYEVVTPYLEADLPELQYTQSADVLTIVNKNYAPAELSRLADDNWMYEPISFISDVEVPTQILASAGAGVRRREYKITAIRRDDYKESLAGLNGNNTIANITKTNPAVVSLNTGAGLYFDGDEVFLKDIQGMLEVNNRRFSIVNVINVGPAVSFELQGEDSTNYATFIPGTGTVFRTIASTTNDALSVATPTTIMWNYVSVMPAQEFNVYRRDDGSGAFGLIGVSRGNEFIDIGITPDTGIQPPTERSPFVKPEDYPGVITYFQQRLFLANTLRDPEKIYSSRIGEFKNFNVYSPIRDDDAITFKISGRQVNEVRHLLDLSKLVAFTTGGEYVINGNDSSLITPTSINTQQQSYNGASILSPLVINDTALYVQERGSVVRDIAFRFEADGYAGDDLTIFAFHLFEGFTLVDWAYQQIPNSVAWAVRSDGVLLGLTYLKEQRIFAWHRHDFGSDKIENVCVVPENDEDFLYVVINRGGNRYVERLSTRQVFNIQDSTFLDSHLTFDGRNTSMTTMTLSGGTNWDYEEDLTLTASASFFVIGDVGNSIFFTDATGAQLRLRIMNYVSNTIVIVRAHKTVPADLRDVAQLVWSKAVDMLSGLDHLEGRMVSVFADGFVVANPNNPSYDQLTVTSGSITLDRPYAYIHVGLPYTSDLETLNIDTPSGETVADKKMIVQSVNIFVEKSRGGFVGPKPPPDNILQGLQEYKIRNSEEYDSPIDLVTGVMEAQIDGEYNDNGRVFIRQTDPLPFTVLSIQPAGMYPFRG